MIEVEHIEAWRGQPVLDPAGEQLGKLEEIYFDPRSGAPVLLSVKSGLLGRHSALIPINGATASRDYLRVAHSKDTVAAAGAGTGDGAPSHEELSGLGATYGLKFADGLELESASQREIRQAEAEAGRHRAAELADTARDKMAQRDAATERAQGASGEAERAEREAQQARQAALEAREEAKKYERE